MSAALVEVTRGPLVDTIHQGDIAIATTSGLALLAGDPAAKVAYWRSAAKPFQALASIEQGATEGWLDDEDLALVCGSHNGEPLHTERVAAMLKRAGIEPALLRCGAQLPLDPNTAHDLIRRGLPPTALHNECSAQHVAMLGLALKLGTDPTGYTSIGHPVQQLLLDRTAAAVDVAPESIICGVDGCHAPTYGLGIDRMAIGYARLLDDEAIGSASSKVHSAWAGSPYLSAGRGRFDSDAMVAVAGIVMKGGSGGILCAGVPATTKRRPSAPAGALGIALKIADGGGLVPREVAMGEVLRQLGILTAAADQSLARYTRPLVLDSAGEAIGEVRPTFTLQTAPRLD